MQPLSHLDVKHFHQNRVPLCSCPVDPQFSSQATAFLFSVTVD